MHTLTLVLGSIPSPSRNGIGIGPLQLRAYGMVIAGGAVLAIWIVQRRWQSTGGDPADVATVATWAVPAGFLGARAYHVITDWQRFEGRRWDVLKIWEGGLGIPGGILAGVVVGVMVARRRGIAVGPMLDAVAPALPVAQAIGRLGNWFNQELFGRPSDLPWAVRIDPEHRPAEFADVATYHPTFLYEGLWNLALAATLVWIGSRTRLRAGQLFVLYVMGYATGRLWVEALRIDPATTLGGVRVNIWVSGATLAVALVVFLARQTRPGPADVAGPGGNQDVPSVTAGISSPGDAGDDHRR